MDSENDSPNDMSTPQRRNSNYPQNTEPGENLENGKERARATAQERASETTAASAAKSTSPTGRTARETHATPKGRVPPNLKESKAAQFEYGRASENSTHHFDTTSRRLERGNPDVGEVDLGNIEADKPAQPDDHDHYD